VTTGADAKQIHLAEVVLPNLTAHTSPRASSTWPAADSSSTTTTPRAGASARATNVPSMPAV